MKRITLNLVIGLLMAHVSFSQHVYIENKTFKVNNCPIYFNGANTPWDNWNDFGGSYDANFWTTHFQTLKNNGINSSRIWITCNGAGQPAINTSGVTTSVSAAFWENCDHLFQQAEANGIYLMPTMMSFDHTKNGNPNTNNWRSMLNSQANVQSFVDNFIVPFVNRYKTNPYLMSIDLCNEIEWIYEDGGTRGSANNWGGSSYAILQRYVAIASAGIHKAKRADGSHVLVTLGSASTKWNGTKNANGSDNPDGNKWSDAALKAQFNDADTYLDYYSPHYYAWMNQYYSSPFERTPAQYGMDDKAVLIGETPCPGPGTPNITVAQSYENLKTNGYQGHYPWTSNGVDNIGSISNFGAAALAFTNSYTSLVRPNCTTTPVVITGTPPSCVITAPHCNAYFPAGSTININVAARDIGGSFANGTVSKVEFFNGATKLGEDLTAPYTYAWSNVTTGTYTITAKATDNDANVSTSAGVIVNVGASAASAKGMSACKGKYLANIIAGSVRSDFNTFWNGVTAENDCKWGSVEGSRDVFNWTGADRSYNHARTNNLPFRYHVLAWGSQYPSWITTLTPAEFKEEMEEYIAAVAARYPLIDQIDVLNEALRTHAGGTPYFRDGLGGANGGVAPDNNTGYDWAVWLFRKAREYFPNAKLVLNDYGLENDPTAINEMLLMVKVLRDRNLIDGFGSQAHTFNVDGLTATTLQSRLDLMANGGVPIYITELDLTGSPSENSGTDATQQTSYQNLFPVFWNHPHVAGVTLWGYVEGSTWRAGSGLLNANGTEKPAMTWLKQYMEGRTDVGYPFCASGGTTNPPSDNLLTNGEFDDGTTGWDIQNNSGGNGTMTVVTNATMSGTNALRICPTTPGTADWHVQVRQNAPFEAGKDYVISFMAKADAVRPMNVGIQQEGDPWTSHFGGQTSLTTANQSFSFNFSPTISDATAKLKFYVGGNATCVTIDNVVFKEASAVSLTATITPAGPTTFCTGGSVILNANTGTGYTYQWRRNGTNILDASSSSYTANQSGSYTVVITQNAVTATSDASTVTVSAAATVADAGAEQNLCNATTTSLAGNTATVGTGTWTKVSGSGTITTPSSPSSGITALTAGTSTFRWTIVNGACSSFDEMIINVSAAATVADAGAEQNLCNATTTSLAGNTATVGTGTWTKVSGSGTITTPSSPTSGITALTSGTSTFRWTIVNGACSSFDEVIINVSAAATVADAGAEQNLCNATTTSLAGNIATVGTGTWTKVSGSGTITTPSSPSSGITALTSGTSTFRWTIVNGPCSSFDEVIINISAAATVADAGADQNLCNTTTATLAGNTATVGTGTWTKVSGSGTITTPSSPSSGITALTPGTSTFRWTIVNGACTSTDDVTINISAAATVADAGAEQNLCNATTTSLAGNTATVGTGTWTKVSGSGTLTNTSSASSGVSALGSGASVFRWTIVNGACTSTDDVTINVSAAATIPDAGAEQNLCNATTTSLVGNTATVGTGTWTKVSGSGTITTPSSPTSGITALTSGTSTFRWTIVNDACSSFDEVIINISAAATVADAGAEQNLCNVTTTSLAGNTATVGTGTWAKVSGSGTLTNASSASSEITALGTGASVFRWTIVNGACTSIDEVIINVSEPATPSDAGADQNICNTNASLSANSASLGTGTWTLIAGTGSFSNVSSPTSDVSGLSNGVNTFRWTIINGSCTSEDNVTIHVSGAPTNANAGSDQTVCEATATLEANTATIGSGVWSVLSGTAIIGNASSTSTSVSGLVPGTSAVLVWTISNGICTSTDEVMIARSFMPTVADAGADQDICNTNTTLSANNASVGAGTWTRMAGGGTFSDASSPTSEVSGLSNGVNTFRWTIVNDACSSTDDVTITVSGAPTTADAGADQNVCNEHASLTANTPVIGSGTWSVVSGTAIIDNASSITSGISGLVTGSSVILKWTIANGACTSADEVVITRNTEPSISNAGADQNITSTTATLAANNPSVGVGAWTVIAGTAILDDASNPATTVTGLSTGVNTLSWTISNGSCTESTDDVSISVGSIPVTTNIDGDLQVSPNQTGVTYSVTNNPGSTYTWTVPSDATIVAGDGTNSITVNFGTSGGTVSVTETNIFGTGSPVSVNVVTSPSGTSSGYAIGTSELYPNPFVEDVTLKITSTSNQEMTLKISDSHGRLLYTLEHQLPNKEIKLGRSLDTGVYFIQAIQGDKSQVMKLIKTR